MRSVPRGVVLGIALLVHLAALYAPRVPGPATDGPPGVDKLGHVAVFALVVVVALWAGLPQRLVLPVLLGHAVLSEVIQHVALDGRSGDPWDVAADVLGVGLGWGAWRWWSRRVSAYAAGRGPSGPGR